MEISSLEQAKNLSDEELLKYLVNYWKLEVPVIYGQVSINPEKKLAWLRKIKNSKGQNLEYPFYDANNPESLRRAGIFIGYDLPEQYNFTDVQISFQIGKAEEREKKSNPFLIRCEKDSIIVLEKISKDDLIYENEEVLLPQTALNYHIKKSIKSAEKQIDKELESKRSILNENETKLNQQKTELESLKIKCTDTGITISQLQVTSNEILESISVKTKKFAQLQIAEEEIIMKIERLKDFIKERAGWLHKLDFITDEVYASLNIEAVPEINLDADAILFKDIDKDFSKLVSYIHSYTFSKGIVYPRFLIEDFLTLLRTNDLIILSGLSGSGKTQIVKSFAEAMGGVAKIIPVKPNWTSSEDLLGFYNPLQKSYLTTPFLDALIEAERDPSRLYLICLDEMNLARVEYYFADFLSALESRDHQPEIILYSEEEADHVFSEFKAVIKILDEARGNISEDSINDFGHFLSNNEINEKLRNIIGINDNETFLSLHSRLRRMLSGILNVPSKLKFPKNVRIIGAINIDETTHYLSPKVLDRSHIIKFESPLRYDIDQITQQINDYKISPKKVYVNTDDFIPIREKYPDYDLNQPLVQILRSWANNYLEKLGIDIGLRTIRQVLLYNILMTELGADEKQILNNIIRHKLLPRLSLDGNKKFPGSEDNLHELIKKLNLEIQLKLDGELIPSSNSAFLELEQIIMKAENADLIYNYWA
jgi:hypothetical protein